MFFQGNMEIWRKRLDFLRKNRLRNRCSKAFLQIAQVFIISFIIIIKNIFYEVNLREILSFFRYLNLISSFGRKQHYGNLKKMVVLKMHAFIYNFVYGVFQKLYLYGQLFLKSRFGTQKSMVFHFLHPFSSSAC